MKKLLLLFLLSLLVVVFQQALFSNIPIMGVNFDFVLVFIVAFSIAGDNLESIAVALFTGIVRDSFFPGMFGVNTIVYLILAYLIGYLQKRIYKDSILIPLLFTFVSTYIKGLIYLFFFYVASYNFDIRKYVLDIILLEAIYNSAISIIVYKVILKLDSKGLLKRGWKF